MSLVLLAVFLPQIMNSKRESHVPDSNTMAVEFRNTGSGGPVEYVSFVDNGEGGGTAGNGIRDGIEKVVQRGFIRYLPDTPRKK